MATWMHLPTLLVLLLATKWVTGSSSCANCEIDGSSVNCHHDVEGEMFKLHFSHKGVLYLQCEPSTLFLNFSSIEECTFLTARQVEIDGCPLPNVSFGEMVFQLGVYPENVTALRFRSRNDQEQQLESWHLNGLANLVELNFQGNGFWYLPENLFAPTPNLRNVNISSNALTTVPENLFFDTPKLKFVDFDNNRIESIPELLFANLSALSNVSFSHNNISEIPTDLFVHNLNLKRLDLRHNQLTSFERNVFRELKALNTLLLESNRLVSLPDGVFFTLESLEELDLSYNFLEELPQKAFDRLTKLETLKLSSNNLLELPNEIFIKCKALKNLSLDRNSLNTIKMEMFPMPDTSLSYLNLGDNNITFTVKSAKILQDSFVTHEDIFPLSRQTNLKRVLLKNNRITTIPHAFNRVFVELEEIDLSGNDIQYVAYYNLHFFQDSVVLNLTDNNIKLLDFHDVYPILKEKVVTLYLQNNDLVCDCRLYRFARILQGFSVGKVDTSLQINVKDKVTCQNQHGEPQAISEVNTKLLTCVVPINRCIENCSCLWRPDDEMFLIDCSHQGLKSLPDLSGVANISVTLDFTNNSLTSLKKLKDPQYFRVVNLTMPNNMISQINQTDLPTTLKILDVRGNNLTSIPEPVLEFFNATDMTLSFGSNPWICDCDLIDFLNFLHVPSRKVTDFEDIRCIDGSDSLLDLTEYSLCPFFMQPMVIVTLVAIGACLLLFAILGTVSFYKYKQGIKVWLYAHRMCLWAITEDEMDADKKFDAFISYSHKDEEFVNTVLVPGLESGDPKYRICLHYRDWVPGEYIQNQILQSVDASRRTIVVLSSNFIESVWGQLEFKAAHSQALQDRTNRIIVIVYGEIPPESELDEKLKLYIATKSYVKWGDAKFWEKLRYIMPHPPKKLNQKGV